MEIIGILAAACELTAVYLLGKMNRLGFLLNVVGNSMWLAYTTLTGNAIGLLLVCSIAIVLNVKGFRRWQNTTS